MFTYLTIGLPWFSPALTARGLVGAREKAGAKDVSVQHRNEVHPDFLGAGGLAFRVEVRLKGARGG